MDGDERKDDMDGSEFPLGSLRAYLRFGSLGESTDMMFSALELRVAKGTRLKLTKRLIIFIFFISHFLLYLEFGRES